MTRGFVDEGRCKPQDTDDDAADGHPNVEPAIYWESVHHSGCCYWSALLDPGAFLGPDSVRPPAD